MDITEKIRRLKELKEKQKLLNQKIIKTSIQQKQNKNVIDKDYLSRLHSENISINKDTQTHKITNGLNTFFKEQYQELYKELENEENRQEFIKNILSNIIYTEYEDLNNLTDISDFKNYTEKLLNNNNNINSTLDIDNNLYYNSENNLTDMLDDENNLTDISDDDELFLSDSESSSSDIDSNNNNNIKNIKSSYNINEIENNDNDENMNTNKLIKLKKPTKDNKLEKSKNEYEEYKNNILKDIEFLKLLPEYKKELCFNYLKEEYNKLTKIIKVFCVKSRNDFINISPDVLSIDLFGYKYINYDERKNIKKNTLLKVIFIYNGIVEIKDFISYKYNLKEKILETKCCLLNNYNTDITNINISKKITKIYNTWIVLSKINTDELINNFCY